jgi:hypothetical protein
MSMLVVACEAAVESALQTPFMLPVIKTAPYRLYKTTLMR